MFSRPFTSGSGVAKGVGDGDFAVGIHLSVTVVLLAADELLEQQWTGSAPEGLNVVDRSVAVEDADPGVAESVVRQSTNRSNPGLARSEAPLSVRRRPGRSSAATLDPRNAGRPSVLPCDGTAPASGGFQASPSPAAMRPTLATAGS